MRRSCSYLSKFEMNIKANSMHAESLKRSYDHISDLPLRYTDRKDATVLIGMNIHGSHEVFDSRKPLNRDPSPEGILTPFGWIAVGPSARKTRSSSSSRRCFHVAAGHAQDDLLHSLVSKF